MQDESKNLEESSLQKSSPQKSSQSSAAEVSESSVTLSKKPPAHFSKNTDALKEGHVVNTNNADKTKTSKIDTAASSSNAAASKTDSSGSQTAAKKSCPAHAFLSLFAVGLICLVAGALFSYFFFSRQGAAKTELSGKSTITKADFNKVAGHFSYKGKDYAITALDAALVGTGIEQYKTPTGEDSYYLPGAESVVAAARNKVIDLIAQEQGISASQQEISEFMKKQFYTDDVKALASQYKLEENQVKDMSKHGVLIEKLRDKVIGKDALPQPISMPAQPKDKAESSKKTAEYYNYIVGILGKEWDATKGSWAATDGPLYKSLNEKLKLDDKLASFEDAYLVYGAANEQLQNKVSELQDKWLKFISKYLNDVQIQLAYLLV